MYDRRPSSTSRTRAPAWVCATVLYLVSTIWNSLVTAIALRFANMGKAVEGCKRRWGGLPKIQTIRRLDGGAQRIGLLDGIGAAAAGGAGGKQDEAADFEGPALIEVVGGDVVVKAVEAGVLEAGDRHMRGEFPLLGGQAQHLADPFVGRLKPLQVLALGGNADIKGVRLVAAERADALEPDAERPCHHGVERIGDLMGEAVLDVADEAQGDVEGFAIDPAGAPNAAAHEFKLKGNIGGNLESGEETRHAVLLIVVKPNQLRNINATRNSNRRNRIKRFMMWCQCVDLPRAEITAGSMRVTIVSMPGAVGCMPSG